MEVPAEQGATPALHKVTYPSGGAGTSSPSTGDVALSPEAGLDGGGTEGDSPGNGCLCHSHWGSVQTYAACSGQSHPWLLVIRLSPPKPEHPPYTLQP